MRMLIVLAGDRLQCKTGLLMDPSVQATATLLFLVSQLPRCHQSLSIALNSHAYRTPAAFYAVATQQKTVQWLHIWSAWRQICFRKIVLQYDRLKEKSEHQITTALINSRDEDHSGCCFRQKERVVYVIRNWIGRS